MLVLFRFAWTKSYVARGSWQLFNEINCRKIFGERNVFAGVTANPWFLSIMATTFALQVVMTQWGGLGLGCVAGGLTLDQVGRPRRER